MNNQTLKDLVTKDHQPVCVVYPKLKVGFELRSGLIHLLSIFRVLVGEDSNKNLKKFHVIFSSIKPTRITKEQIKIMALPLYLVDSAKEGLYYRPFGSITI